MARTGSRRSGRSSSRESGRHGARGGARDSSRRSGRGGARESSKRASRQSSSTVVVGAAVAGAVVVALGLVLFVGASTGRSRAPSRRRSARVGISPEEARRLKSEGMKEFEKGRALYRQAGRFGSPSYARKMDQARPHLQRALDHFSDAQTVLRHDRQLVNASEECGKLLSASFKVPVGAR